MATDDPPGARDGRVYAAFVRTRVAEEERRAAAFQTQGLVVVTSAAALMVVLVAISSLLRTYTPQASSTARTLMDLAIVALVLAALCGLSATRRGGARRAEPEDLWSQIEHGWNHSRGEAERVVALAGANALESRQDANDGAARALLVALSAEVLATGLAGAAACLIMAAEK